MSDWYKEKLRRDRQILWALLVIFGVIGLGIAIAVSNRESCGPGEYRARGGIAGICKKY
ncbi:MAG TPA: hypothetical protein VEC99_18370 [Clostridia bacterium]|nr:hypothetical protein [Clostridia bacterium]